MMLMPLCFLLSLAPTTQEQPQQGLQQWLEDLTGEDADKRDAAIKGAKSLAARAVPHLIPLLKSKSSLKRQLAARALEQMGADAILAAPTLAEAMADSDAAVRRWSSKALRKMGEPALPVLINRVLHRHPTAQIISIQLIGALEAKGKPAIPTLLSQLDSFPSVRKTVIHALMKMGAAAQAAVPELIGLARNDSSAQIRELSILALGEIGPGAKEAIPILIENLKKKKFSTSDAAGMALGKIGKAALPSLRPLLRSREPWDQQASLKAIGGMGSHGEAASKEIVALLEAKDGTTRLLAARALGQIQSRSSVPALMQCLQEKDTGLVLESIQALGRIGKHARSAVVPLTAFLQHPNPEIRGNAALTLGLMGPAAKDALGVLLSVHKKAKGS